jgi:hypothetical protein
MFGSDALDLAIGLAFVYLTVSFVCSAAVELIEVWAKNRPKKLYDGIKELLQSDDLVADLYNQPLVSALYKGGYVPRGGNLPSYIPARNFALALFSFIPDPNNTDSVETLRARLDDDFYTAADRQELDALRKAGTKSPRRIDLEARAHIHGALVSIITGAQGKADAIVKGVEDWYNSAMNSVSGSFKRYTHIWLLFFGAIAAVAMNIDTMRIVKELSTNKTKRDAIVASASAAVEKGTPAHAEASTVKEAEKNLVTSIDEVNALGLPIGWPKTAFDATQILPAVREHLLGWIITAVAVSFGAPFWFDVLNKFIVVRSTVKPKEKTGTEASKDPSS